MPDNADTHAPPAGYVQALPTIEHDDHLPEGLLTTPIAVEQYPATIHALNLIRMDSGGPSWPAQDATLVPIYWLPFLPTIEHYLNELDGGDRSTIDLDNEMFTFACGEEDAMRAIAHRNPGLQLASVFLSDFFEGWSYMIEPIADHLRSEVIAAYKQGALDVHNNWQEDRDPDFTEAAHDYASSRPLTPPAT